MSAMRSCHHYYLGGETCRLCGYDKTPGTLIDQHGLVHHRTWKEASHSLCVNDFSYPERILRVKNTRRKVVTCLSCIRRRS
jgi:hypothetical protein